MTRVSAGSALTPQAAVERLGDQSAEVRAAALIDERGNQAASASADGADAEGIAELASELFSVADAAGSRAGLAGVERVEIARPEGGVFGVRGRDAAGRSWTLVAVTAGGALSSLVFYDIQMTIRALGAPA
ncbi:MAG: hypothetical protein H0V08_03090 [Thermoleophilaceae bacterium]|nr:hypothetical protein [Thermoleophilaceae bacterium]